MVQNLSGFSNQQLRQQLERTLKQVFSESDFLACLKQVEIQKPTAGKRFWQTVDAPVGIYIILTGKVRLLDSNDNLITSLEIGASFGESTLFPQEEFQPCVIRASVNSTLCFIPESCLLSLFSQYFNLQEHLYQQALLRDLLLLSRQTDVLGKAPVEEVMKTLSLLERHDLEVGKLAKPLVKDQQLWLLRQGELLHSSGRRLTSGDIYAPSQLLKHGTWQATQPTQLYSLHKSHWETALHYLPQLTALIEFDTTPADTQSVEAFPRKTEVTVFPQSTPTVELNTQTTVSKAYFPSPSVRIGHWWQRVTRRYPFFFQQSSSDCGAACLVIVGRYWGKQFSVNRLRDIANVDRDGASLRGLAAAAESIGFTTRPVKASLDKLAEQQLPAIIHWEGRHYIVVHEVTRSQVIVADPAIGQCTLSYAEFKAGWTGYALLLQPTALLKSAKEASQPFWQFLELVKPYWLVMLEVFIASILIQIFGLITPLFTQLLLDRVVVQQSNLTLVTIGIGLLFFGLFRVAMTGLRQYLLDQTANRVDLSLIVGFIRHTFRLPLSFFENRYVGDILSRVQENRKIQRFLTGEALSIMLDLLTVFIYVGLMLWYSWKMAILTLAIIPPFVLLALLATPFLQRISRKIFNAFNEETGYLIQSLTGIRTVKSMAIEQTVRWHWEELFVKSLKNTFSGQMINNILLTFSSGIEAVTTTVLLWFGAWLVIQNELTIGQLVAFQMLLSNVITPFQRLIVLWNELQEVIIAMERINDVIDAEPEEDLQQQTRQSLSQIQGHIRFEKLTFRYHPESDINTLENVSFEIQPGQMVALVGRSGSGKTTISKLILGLYPPTEGKVLIDGYDVTSLSLRTLRQHIGVVDQDSFLFGSTIRENISVGHPEANLEDVIKATELAGAHQFIKDLPMAYETQIGEGGGMLSGGQRQRLAIARALLGNPRLLILDEATSHLDAESERIIQNNLNKILQGRTTLVIAHRLSTVRNADLILVLDRGILVESGTHEQLMAKRGQYFYLNQQQLAIVS